MNAPLSNVRDMRPVEVFTPESQPTYTLERQVAEARTEMGDARWAALNAEWDAPVPHTPSVPLIRGGWR